MTQSRFHLAKGTPHRQAFPFDGLYYYRVSCRSISERKDRSGAHTGSEGERAVIATSPHSH
jgi:hypothetical protein